MRTLGLGSFLSSDLFYWRCYFALEVVWTSTVILLESSPFARLCTLVSAAALEILAYLVCASLPRRTLALLFLLLWLSFYFGTLPFLCGGVVDWADFFLWDLLGGLPGSCYDARSCAGGGWTPPPSLEPVSFCWICIFPLLLGACMPVDAAAEAGAGIWEGSPNRLLFAYCSSSMSELQSEGALLNLLSSPMDVISGSTRLFWVIMRVLGGCLDWAIK